MTERKVTLEEVLAKRTPRGSWTRKQIEEWGLEWPPRAGWIKRLTGDENAKASTPGRTPLPVNTARKTRRELEYDVMNLTAEVSELRRKITELEEKAGVW